MGTVSGAYFKSMIDGCVVNGVDSKALYDFVPGGKEGFDNPLSRFPCEDFINVLNTAVSLTGDQSLGIKAGLTMRPGSIMDLGNALTVCDNLTEAMALNYRYQPLVQQLGRTQLDVKSKVAELFWTPHYTATERYRYFLEYLYTRYVVIGNWLIFNEEDAVLKTEFRHMPPEDSTFAKQVFGDNIIYNASRDCLSFRPELAVMPLVTANPEVKNILFTRLDKQLSDLGENDSVSEKVIHLIHTILPKGRPSLSDVSELMGMSDRTLRRSLTKEGTSFRGLLEEVRKEACCLYMRQNRHSYAQIAQILGFSDQSAFSRAFRQWYGTTPKAFHADQNVKAQNNIDIKAQTLAS